MSAAYLKKIILYQNKTGIYHEYKNNMKKNNNYSIYISAALLTLSISSQASMTCKDIFKINTPLIEPGIGVITNKKGQPEVRIKLSDADNLQPNTFNAKIANFLNSLLAGPSRYFKTKDLNEFVQRLYSDQRPISFKHKLMDALLLKSKFSFELAKKNIPSNKPLIIIANHVRAGVDGIPLASMATLFRERDDVLIVLTERLSKIKDLPENTVLIDDSETPAAYIRNKAPRKKIEDHLKNGGAIVIFPSGNNATRYPLKSINAGKKLTPADYPYDALWQAGTYKFALEIPDTVILPMFVDGQLSENYQIAKATKSGTASALLLPYEIGQQIGDTVTLTIGQPLRAGDVLDIAKQYVQNYQDDLTPSKADLKRAQPHSHKDIIEANAFLGYLRNEVYALQNVIQTDAEAHTATQWLNLINNKN